MLLRAYRGGMSQVSVGTTGKLRVTAPSTAVISSWLERAQTGHAQTILDRCEDVLGHLSSADSLGVRFVQAITLDCLGRVDDAVVVAAELAKRGEAAGSAGWTATGLAFGAQLEVSMGDRDDDRYDTERVMRDLARAEIALAEGESDDFVATAAHCGIGNVYSMQRLYELAVPHYEAARRVGLRMTGAGGTPEIASANLAMMHLQWALELRRVGLLEEFRERCSEAGRHAANVQSEARGPDAPVWRDAGALYAGCANAVGDDPLTAAGRIRAGVITMRGRGMDADADLAQCFQAIALDHAGRPDDALRVIEDAIATLRPDAEMMTAAAITHTHAAMLRSRGVQGASVALVYGDRLAQALWRERVRAVQTARALREVERLRTEHESMSRRALTDALTGVLNRQGFDERVGELGELPAALHPVGVLIVDLDRFKQINDTLGHGAGDEALRRVAAAVEGVVRGGDTVARVGGDEFAVLLPGAGLEAARRVGGRIVASVAELGDPMLTVSVGIAVATGAELRDCLVSADQAMYVAKRAGGGRLSVA